MMSGRGERETSAARSNVDSQDNKKEEHEEKLSPFLEMNLRSGKTYQATPHSASSPHLESSSTHSSPESFRSSSSSFSSYSSARPSQRTDDQTPSSGAADNPTEQGRRKRKKRKGRLKESDGYGGEETPLETSEERTDSESGIVEREKEENETDLSCEESASEAHKQNTAIELKNKQQNRLSSSGLVLCAAEAATRMNNRKGKEEQA